MVLCLEYTAGPSTPVPALSCSLIDARARRVTAACSALAWRAATRFLALSNLAFKSWSLEGLGRGEGEAAGLGREPLRVLGEAAAREAEVERLVEEKEEAGLAEARVVWVGLVKSSAFT